MRILKKMWIVSKKNKTIRCLLSFFYCILNCKKDIHGKFNKIDYNNAFLKKVEIVINGNDNAVVIKDNARIFNTIINITGDNNNIFIDKDCIIKKSGLWINGHDCKIEIGESTTIESVHFAAIEPKTKIQIGRDCMLSSGISIQTSDTHRIIDLNSGERINNPSNILIGNHVWIAQGARILKGVNIGDNSVIGAGSIVTNSISQNCVAVGIPAKAVKENVYWER